MSEPTSDADHPWSDTGGPYTPGVHPATGEPDPLWDVDADGQPVHRSPRVGPSSTGVRIVVGISVLVLVLALAAYVALVPPTAP